MVRQSNNNKNEQISWLPSIKWTQFELLNHYGCQLEILLLLSGNDEVIDLKQNNLFMTASVKLFNQLLENKHDTQSEDSSDDEEKNVLKGMLLK